MKNPNQVAEELRALADAHVEKGSKAWGELHRISGFIEGLAEGIPLTDEARRAQRETDFDEGHAEGYRDGQGSGSPGDANPHRKPGR